jgi:hypothetical protein
MQLWRDFHKYAQNNGGQEEKVAHAWANGSIDAAQREPCSPSVTCPAPTNLSAFTPNTASPKRTPEAAIIKFTVKGRTAEESLHPILFTAFEKNSPSIFVKFRMTLF